MSWWLPVAMAQDLSAYPWVADVELPPTGVSAVVVPWELRSADDPEDGSDLLLVDAEGRVVPTARWTGGGRSAEDVFDGSHGFVVSPTEDADVWRLEVTGRSIDVLLAKVPLGSSATITVLPSDGPRASALVWTIDDLAQEEVPLAAPLVGEAQVAVDWHLAPGERVPAFGGRIRGPVVPPTRWDVPLRPPRAQENGWLRYDLALDRALPVAEAELQPTAPLFSRSGALVSRAESSPVAGLTSPDLETWNPSPLRRIDLGGGSAPAEALTVVGREQGASAAWSVLVDRPAEPLEIPAVTLSMPGVELLVRDPGAGPFTLYGGAPVGSAPPSELPAAAPELARMRTARVATGPVRSNPVHVLPEIASGLGAPATEVELRGLAWSRSVDGPPGLVTIPLDAQVLAHARDDLGDLRLLDDLGRQLPFAMRSVGAEVSFGPLPVERREAGSVSWLEVELPVRGAVVSSVSLATATPRFVRTVTVSRPSGGRLAPVRAFSWDGAAMPSTLTLGVGERFEDALVVEVDNGDNAPLEVGAVDVRWPQWELVAVLGEDGARLVYGDRRREPPDYDFARYSRSRAVAVATLGPEERLQPAALGWVDRGLVVMGIGALALGLLAVLASLVFARPEEETNKEPRIGLREG